MGSRAGQRAGPARWPQAGSGKPLGCVPGAAAAAPCMRPPLSARAQAAIVQRTCNRMLMGPRPHSYCGRAAATTATSGSNLAASPQGKQAASSNERRLHHGDNLLTVLLPAQPILLFVFGGRKRRNLRKQYGARLGLDLSSLSGGGTAAGRRQFAGRVVTETVGPQPHGCPHPAWQLVYMAACGANSVLYSIKGGATGCGRPPGRRAAGQQAPCCSPRTQ